MPAARQSLIYSHQSAPSACLNHPGIHCHKCLSTSSPGTVSGVKLLSTCQSIASQPSTSKLLSLTRFRSLFGYQFHPRNGCMPSLFWDDLCKYNLHISLLRTAFVAHLFVIGDIRSLSTHDERRARYRHMPQRLAPSSLLKRARVRTWVWGLG